MNPAQSEIESILRGYKRVTIVGLSPDPARPSHDIARYLLGAGYEITGVRPSSPKTVLGIPMYDSVAQVPGPLEILDVFRAPEHIPALIKELIPLKPKVIWLQLGISHPEAEGQARAAGITVISDRCIKVEHYRSVR